MNSSNLCTFWIFMGISLLKTLLNSMKEWVISPQLYFKMFPRKITHNNYKLIENIWRKSQKIENFYSLRTTISTRKDMNTMILIFLKIWMKNRINTIVHYILSHIMFRQQRILQLFMIQIWIVGYRRITSLLSKEKSYKSIKSKSIKLW